MGVLPNVQFNVCAKWNMFGDEHIDGLDALVSDLTVVPVHGCGHFVPWEAPEAVNRAMRDFLA